MYSNLNNRLFKTTTDSFVVVYLHSACKQLYTYSKPRKENERKLRTHISFASIKYEWNNVGLGGR